MTPASHILQYISIIITNTGAGNVYVVCKIRWRSGSKNSEGLSIFD